MVSRVQLMWRSHAATIDLHLHTLASDGRLTPTELIQMAENGRKTISVTDHERHFQAGALDITDPNPKYINLKIESEVRLLEHV